MTPPRRVALLRGVNVGGVTVKSAELAELFRELGFTDVKTVLASGNVLFDGPGTTAEQTTTIENGLSKAFGYRARVVVTDQAALAALIDGYPFDEVDDRQPYVVFTPDAADLPRLLEAASLDDAVERVERGDGVLYWEVRKGMSTDSAFSKRISKSSAPVTTTRNLRTLRKLI